METEQKAVLALENGTIFQGTAFGYLSQTVGEVVFNTGMTGYQELLTDPSYAGQIVAMTYPLIGNYGINLEDFESRGPKLKGFVCREACDCPSNWRCEMNLADYLKGQKIMGIQGVDTRALTLILRKEGTMRGLITTQLDITPDQIKAALNAPQVAEEYTNVIAHCTIPERYEIPGQGKHVAFLDLGVKSGILRDLSRRGCKITVLPAFTSAEEILALKADCLFLSNGPGDPKDVPEIIATVASLVGKIPMLGVCMGNQLINLALGGNTTKMPFGHHGGNHPVREIATGKVYITSQNHEYVVCDLPDCLEPAFVNVNDGTIEGIRHKTLPIASVQFHPEASPGPLDAGVLFDQLLALIEGGATHA